MKLTPAQLAAHSEIEPHELTMLWIGCDSCGGFAAKLVCPCGFERVFHPPLPVRCTATGG